MPSWAGQLVAVPAAHSCGLEFQRYVASDWEKRWLDERDSLSGKICATMLKQTKLTERWMKAIQPWFKSETTVDDTLLQRVLDDAEVSSASTQHVLIQL